jgi:hypothetical protein
LDREVPVIYEIARVAAVVLGPLVAVFALFAWLRLRGGSSTRVRRHQVDIFALPIERIRAAVAAALRHPPTGCRYVKTRIENGGDRASTTVRPWLWPLLLDTRMTLEIVPLGPPGLFKVSAGTQAQWFITGDVFGFYLGYIAHALGEVRRGLGEGV